MWFFGLAFPFSAGSTAPNLYRSIVISTPTNDTDENSSQYCTEADSIKILEPTRRNALFSQPQID